MALRAGEVVGSGSLAGRAAQTEVQKLDLDFGSGERRGALDAWGPATTLSVCCLHATEAGEVIHSLQQLACFQPEATMGDATILRFRLLDHTLQRREAREPGQPGLEVSSMRTRGIRVYASQLSHSRWGGRRSEASELPGLPLDHGRARLRQEGPVNMLIQRVVKWASVGGI
jgi:hypothetical protein